MSWKIIFFFYTWPYFAKIETLPNDGLLSDNLQILIWHHRKNVNKFQTFDKFDKKI